MTTVNDVVAGQYGLAKIEGIADLTIVVAGNGKSKGTLNVFAVKEHSKLSLGQKIYRTYKLTLDKKLVHIVDYGVFSDSYDHHMKMLVETLDDYCDQIATGKIKNFQEFMPKQNYTYGTELSEKINTGMKSMVKSMETMGTSMKKAGELFKEYEKSFNQIKPEHMLWGMNDGDFYIPKNWYNINVEMQADWGGAIKGDWIEGKGEESNWKGSMKDSWAAQEKKILQAPAHSSKDFIVDGSITSKKDKNGNVSTPKSDKDENLEVGDLIKIYRENPSSMEGYTNGSMMVISKVLTGKEIKEQDAVTGHDVVYYAGPLDHDETKWTRHGGYQIYAPTEVKLHKKRKQ